MSSSILNPTAHCKSSVAEISRNRDSKKYCDYEVSLMPAHHVIIVI